LVDLSLEQLQHQREKDPHADEDDCPQSAERSVQFGVCAPQPNGIAKFEPVLSNGFDKVCAPDRFLGFVALIEQCGGGVYLFDIPALIDKPLDRLGNRIRQGRYLRSAVLAIDHAGVD
jgi:hypothetical protein